jgi:hypothetical protein
MGNIPSAILPRRSWREWVLLGLVCLLVGWSYLGDKCTRHGFYVPTAESYYGLLTEALPAGRTNLNIVAEIRFLRLADPWAGPQDTNRPHDMSFYKGNFYIYYGITPVLILMLPWHVATGTFLTEPATTALLCFGGFLLGAWWLADLRRRLAPSLSLGWLLVALIVWGWGSPILTLSHNNTFYAVPIAGGFFCIMVVLVAVDRALRSPRMGHAAAWMILASLFHGLSVGARPIYAFSLPLLLIPAGVLWWRHQRHGVRRPLLTLAAATVVPAALVGAGLAYYNYVRFEDPLEFGIRYSLGPGSQRDIRLMGLEFIPKNLRNYLLQPASFIRYYPFVHNDTRPFGLLPHWTLGVLALATPLTLLRRAWRRDGAWPSLAILVLGLAITNLFAVCLFFGEVDRYLNDYVPLALLGGCVVLLFLAAEPWQWEWLRRSLQLLAVLTGVWTLGNGLGFGLTAMGRTPVTERVESFSNAISYAIESLGGRHYGPLEFGLVFPEFRGASARQPLLSTGYLRGTGDILYIVDEDERHVRFGFFHLGSGGPESPSVEIERGRTYRVRIELGSLYPASLRHPVFSKFDGPQIDRLLRRFEIALDGKSVMRAEVAVYPSTPAGVRLGANDLASDVSPSRFEGRISAVRRLAPPLPASIFPEFKPGPVMLRFSYPAARSDNFQPLICTGVNGSGDVLAIQVRPDGRIRFMHDSWNGSAYYSDFLPRDDGEQVLEVEMGSLYPASDPAVPPDVRGRFRLRLNGRMIADLRRPFNPSETSQVVFGYNAIQGGSTQQMFSGTIHSVEPLRPTASP